MAESPTHQLGESIGRIFEDGALWFLKPITDDRGLYLDYAHPRRARGGKKKVSWTDINGNVHDLDLVVEHGGTEDVIGQPRAFVEVAWRRYTKHARNKVQEIFGAVGPIAELYSNLNPFTGAILAGDFTGPSLDQLRTEGFAILHFTFDDIVNAFKANGLDVYYKQDTPDSVTKPKADVIKTISKTKKEDIIETIFDRKDIRVKSFQRAIEKSLDRKVKEVTIRTLYSEGIFTFSDVNGACKYLANVQARSRTCLPLDRIEIEVKFTNGDEIMLSYQDANDAIRYLRSIVRF